MITNYMEIVVEDILASVLKEHKLACDCEICIADVKAITLNNVKPMYVVSNKGLMYNKLNELNMQFKADVVAQLMNSIKIVEAKPSH
nr:late competence development ComFB family protein [Tissierella sp.]